jgi:hypothetical protein
MMAAALAYDDDKLLKVQREVCQTEGGLLEVAGAASGETPSTPKMRCVADLSPAAMA